MGVCFQPGKGGLGRWGETRDRTTTHRLPCAVAPANSGPPFAPDILSPERMVTETESDVNDRRPGRENEKPEADESASGEMRRSMKRSELAAVHGVAAEDLLDAEQLVVLGDAVGAAEGPGLDLAGVGGDGDVGDGGVLSLA